MIGRRKFLQVLGITPLAAKAAAEQTAADLTLRNWAAAPLASAVENLAAHSAPIEIGGGENLYTKMSAYLRLSGKLPDHVEEQFRRNALRVVALDPDIAIKRSWSFCVKIQAQRQRNYEREIEQIKVAGAWGIAQKKFRELTGFEWRW